MENNQSHNVSFAKVYDVEEFDGFHAIRGSSG